MLEPESERQSGSATGSADGTTPVDDGAEVVLRPGSQLKIDAYRFEERTPDSDGFVVSLLKGGMRSVTGLLARRNPERATYTTPAGAREFSIGEFGFVASPGVVPVPVPAGQGIRATLPPQAIVARLGAGVGRAGERECRI